MRPEAGVHTFHFIGTCPWTNMSATLHMYAALHCSWSLHRNPKLLYMSVKTQQNAILIYHASTIYVLATIMPLKCHICAIFPNCLTCTYGGSALMCHMKAALFSNVARITVYRWCQCEHRRITFQLHIPSWPLCQISQEYTMINPSHFCVYPMQKEGENLQFLPKCIPINSD